MSSWSIQLRDYGSDEFRSGYDYLLGDFISEFTDFETYSTYWEI